MAASIEVVGQERKGEARGQNRVSGTNDQEWVQGGGNGWLDGMRSALVEWNLWRSESYRTEGISEKVKAGLAFKRQKTCHLGTKKAYKPSGSTQPISSQRARPQERKYLVKNRLKQQTWEEEIIGGARVIEEE